MASRYLDGPYRRPPRPNEALVEALLTALAHDMAHADLNRPVPYWFERIGSIQAITGETRDEITAEVRGLALAIRERRAR